MQYSSPSAAIAVDENLLVVQHCIGIRDSGERRTGVSDIGQRDVFDQVGRKHDTLGCLVRDVLDSFECDGLGTRSGNVANGVLADMDRATVHHNAPEACMPGSAPAVISDVITLDGCDRR